jgi:hypothetical protein
VEVAAQEVLDARAAFPDAALADLYDPLAMPSALVKAHAKLDHAVETSATALNLFRMTVSAWSTYLLFTKSSLRPSSLLPKKTDGKNRMVAASKIAAVGRLAPSGW